MAQDLTNTSHIVAESTNLLSTNFGGGHIYSVVMGADMDNGLLVARDVYDGEEYTDEVWTTKDYAAGDEPLLLLTPPLLPMNSLKSYTTEDKFYNGKGEIARAYTLHVGDRFTLTENAFSEAPTVKQYVVYNASAKNYTVSGEKTDGQFCAQVISKIARSNMTSYKLMVVGL